MKSCFPKPGLFHKSVGVAACLLSLGLTFFDSSGCIYWLSCAAAHAEAPSEAQQGASDAFGDLRRKVERFELSNGLRVIFLRRETSPVFWGQTWVRVGAIDEIPGATGISHLLEHMAFKGSQVIGTKDFKAEQPLLARYEFLMTLPKRSAEQTEELKKVTADLEKLWNNNEFARVLDTLGGQDLNAGTGKDYTTYHVSLPSVAFESWCWLESDRIISPVFRQFFKELQVVLEERRMRVDDNPDGQLYEALMSLAYWNHPNRLPVIGWPEDLKSLQPADLRVLYKKYYRPENMVVTLVGDLEPQVVRAQLEKYFGRIPRGEGPLPSVKLQEPAQKGERQVSVVYNAEPALLLGYRKPAHPNPDDAKFAIFHNLLSGGRASILYRELVQERQVASSVSTSEGPGELFDPLFIVTAVPRKGVTAAALRDSLQRIFDRIAVHGVSADQLEAAKRRVRVAYLAALESNEGLASALGRAELLFGDWTVPFEQYSVMLNTNVDDVKRLAATYLDRSRRNYVFIEKP